MEFFPGNRAGDQAYEDLTHAGGLSMFILSYIGLVITTIVSVGFTRLLCVPDRPTLKRSVLKPSGLLE